MFPVIKYFSELAAQHKVLANSESNRSFFVESGNGKFLLDLSNFFLELKATAKTILICQFSGDSQILGNNIDQLLNKQICTCFFLTKISKPDALQISAASDFCRSIFDDFYSRLLFDFRQGKLPFANFTDVDITPLGLIADFYTGVAATFAFFESYEPEYIPDKWT